MRLYTRGWEAEATAATRAALDEYTDTLQQAGVEIATREIDSRILQIENALDDAFAGRSVEITAYEMRWPYEQYATRYGALIEPRVHERLNQARVP